MDTLKPLRAYSGFFTTLYDQTSEVGTIGRGTHYSVFKYDHSSDIVHKFAVIWDEDRDLRIIHALERLMSMGLLEPVMFVGERKGTLSVIIDPAYLKGPLAQYTRKISDIADSMPLDPWGSDVELWNSTEKMGGNIIHGPGDSDLYLRSIAMLWRLEKRIPKPNPLDYNQ